MDILITFIILIFSAIIHEVCHGLMAERLGDDTARRMGRITLNPIPHIDIYGTILLPALMYFATSGRFFFGAAKPVPVNFNNLSPRRLGMALVSLAGPASNFLLAVIFIGLYKFHFGSSLADAVFMDGALVNIILGTFNLIPIPPLDGSKVLASLLPEQAIYQILSWERFGFILILVFLYFGWLQLILIPVLSWFGNFFGVSFF